MKPENATRMAPLDWTPAMRLETYGLMAKHVPGSLAMPHTILNLSNAQQKVCRPLACATSRPGSSRSCWRTAQRTTFPGPLSTCNCQCLDSKCCIKICLCCLDLLWFKTNATPTFLPERCELSVGRTGLYFRCTSCRIYFGAVFGNL